MYLTEYDRRFLHPRIPITPGEMEFKTRKDGKRRYRKGKLTRCHKGKAPETSKCAQEDQRVISCLPVLYSLARPPLARLTPRCNLTRTNADDREGANLRHHAHLRPSRAISKTAHQPISIAPALNSTSRPCLPPLRCCPQHRPYSSSVGRFSRCRLASS